MDGFAITTLPLYSVRRAVTIATVPTHTRAHAHAFGQHFPLV